MKKKSLRPQLSAPVQRTTVASACQEEAGIDPSFLGLIGKGASWLICQEAKYLCSRGVSQGCAYYDQKC